MIEKTMNLNYFTYKKPFSGSDNGNKFKYVLRLVEEDEFKKLRAVYWTKETNYVMTDDKDKIVKDFEFSDEGYDNAVMWLNAASAASVN